MGEKETASATSSRELLRHTVATLAYRGGKALRGAPDGFAQFRAGETTRTPGQILAHICDLLDWGLSLAQGHSEMAELRYPSLGQGIGAFLRELCRHFDAYLASDAPLGCPPRSSSQAPLADALTHVGQISMLRRLAGAPVRGENYFQG